MSSNLLHSAHSSSNQHHIPPPSTTTLPDQAPIAADTIPYPHLLHRFFHSSHSIEVSPQHGSEWCLNQVFARFISLSETKLNVVLVQSTEREIDLARYLQPGVDLEFDQCLHTLGSLAKHLPCLAINTLMAWRDSAGDLPADAASHHSNPIVTNSSSLFSAHTSSSIRGSVRHSVKVMEPGRDIRLITCNILFCRSLIEIIRCVSVETLLDEIGLKCEELCFSQLRLSIPDLIRNSSNWHANATYFARVLGELSHSRFTSVTDRYLLELEKLSSTQLKEGKAEHLVYGLKFIHLKLYPMDALDDTADFLDSLGHFFLNSIDISVRQAFMETFVELLSPLCQLITAEVNVPMWVAFVESVFPKVQKLAVRPRHQSVAFSLLACLLSISRQDFFNKHWMTVLEISQSKFKDRDRSLRQEALKCLSQLVWIYLYRYSEPTSVTQKRIAMLIKLLFPTGRRSIYPLEVPIEIFAYIIYMTGVRYPGWTVSNIIAPLIEGQGNPESTWSSDRMSIAIYAMNWLLSAWSTPDVGKPDFPVFPISSKLSKPALPLPEVSAKHQQAFLQPVSGSLHRILDVLHGLIGGFQLDDEKSRVIIPIKVGSPSNNTLYADLLGTVRSSSTGTTASAPVTMATTPSTASFSTSANTVGGNASTGGAASLTLLGETLQTDPSVMGLAPSGTVDSPALFIASIPPSRVPLLELLKILFNSAPRIIPFYERERMIDILCTYVTHVDRGLSDAAVGALTRMAQANPVPTYQDILVALEPKVFAIVERKCDLLTPYYVKASEDPNAQELAHRGSLEIYADFFAQGRTHTRQLPLDALGLYLLCSPVVTVRRLAIQILENANSMTTKLLSKTGLLLVASSTTRAGMDEWASQFPEFISYCVDFLPRDSVKKAVQVALDRTTILHAILSPPETGILWTNAVRSPPDENVLHWKRCATLVLLGAKYLSSPREVLATYLQLVGSEFTSVREAALAALAHTSSSHQAMLLDEAIPLIHTVADDARLRGGKRFTMPKKPGRIDRLRTDVPRLVTSLDEVPSVVMPAILNYVRALRLWLVDQRNNPDVDPVRVVFCKFLTMLYTRILTVNRAVSAVTPHVIKLMDMRGPLLLLLSDWDNDVYPTLEAIACLLRGPIPSSRLTASATDQGYDRNVALKWINSMLRTSDRCEIGLQGLVNLLQGNASSKALHESLVQACFKLPRGDPVSQYYLKAFATVFILVSHTDKWTVTSLETVLILGLVKLADDHLDIQPLCSGITVDQNQKNVGKDALAMIKALQDSLFLDLDAVSVADSINKPIICRSSCLAILERIMRYHPEWTLGLLSELFSRVADSNLDVQVELLAMASLMTRYVALGSNSELLLHDSRFVIENYIYLTMTRSDSHALLIRQGWTNLVVESGTNLKAVVAYFIQHAKDTRSECAVMFFRVILSFISDVDTTFLCILPYLTPATFILFPSESLTDPRPTPYYTPNLDSVIPVVVNRHPWSDGVVASLFLVGLIPYLSPVAIEQYLALFLEVSISQLDHPDKYVACEMKKFLCSLFQHNFTLFDDIPSLLHEIIQVLPLPIVDAWNSISLRWASNCTIMHVAIKSLQMFQCSLRRPNADMLQNLLQMYIGYDATTIVPTGSVPTHEFSSGILAGVLCILSHPTFNVSEDLAVQTLDVVLQSMVNPPAEHVNLLIKIAKQLLDSEPHRIAKVNIDCISPYKSVSMLLLSVHQAHCHDEARELINALYLIPEPLMEWKPVLIILNNLMYMTGPVFLEELDDLYRQVITHSQPSAKSLTKYLATWVKYRAKSLDDLMLQLSHALRDPFLGLYGDLILQTSLRFISSSNHSTVHTYLLFLHQILPLLQIRIDQEVPTSYLSIMLEYSQSDTLAALSLQVLDQLLKLIPSVSEAAISVQGVLPPMPAAIPKKSKGSLMEEWSRSSTSQSSLNCKGKGWGKDGMSKTFPKQTTNSASSIANILSMSPPLIMHEPNSPLNTLTTSPESDSPLTEEFPALPITIDSPAKHYLTSTSTSMCLQSESIELLHGKSIDCIDAEQVHRTPLIFSPGPLNSLNESSLDGSHPESSLFRQSNAMSTLVSPLTTESMGSLSNMMFNQSTRVSLLPSIPPATVLNIAPSSKKSISNQAWVSRSGIETSGNEYQEDLVGHSVVTGSSTTSSTHSLLTAGPSLLMVHSDSDLELASHAAGDTASNQGEKQKFHDPTSFMDLSVKSVQLEEVSTIDLTSLPPHGLENSQDGSLDSLFISAPNLADVSGPAQ